jgi:hypothetical protein
VIAKAAKKSHRSRCNPVVAPSFSKACMLGQ